MTVVPALRRVPSLLRPAGGARPLRRLPGRLRAPGRGRGLRRAG